MDTLFIEGDYTLFPKGRPAQQLGRKLRQSDTSGLGLAVKVIHISKVAQS